MMQWLIFYLISDLIRHTITLLVATPESLRVPHKGVAKTCGFNNHQEVAELCLFNEESFKYDRRVTKTTVQGRYNRKGVIPRTTHMFLLITSILPFLRSFLL